MGTSQKKFPFQISLLRSSFELITVYFNQLMSIFESGANFIVVLCVVGVFV